MVGCLLAIFQQLTGINVIMFYSNTVFKSSDPNEKGLSATTITGIVGLVNFVTTFGGMALLAKFGRRTIMLWCQITIIVILAVIGISF